MNFTGIKAATLFESILHGPFGIERESTAEFLMQKHHHSPLERDEDTGLGKNQILHDSLLIQDIVDGVKIPILLFTSSGVVYFIPTEVAESIASSTLTELTVDDLIKIGKVSLSSYGRVGPDSNGLFHHTGDCDIFDPDGVLDNPSRLWEQRPWHLSPLLATRFTSYGALIGYEVVLARHLDHSGVIEQLKNRYATRGS